MMQQVKMKLLVVGLTHMVIITIHRSVFCLDYSEWDFDDQTDYDGTDVAEGEDRLILPGLLQGDREPSIGGLIDGCPKLFDSIFSIHQADMLFVSPASLRDVVIDIANTDSSRAVDYLVRSGFNLSQQTVMYTHGWMESGQSDWLLRVREQYSILFQYKTPTFNLLIFDWSEVAAKKYGRAARKSPNLGDILSRFFDTLNTRHNYHMSNLHLVGFSMSAHIVGTAGRLLTRMGKKVRQITAIDPAGPCFFNGRKFAMKNSLTSDVADLVVALHYNYGTVRPIGGVDIYVNGGTEQTLSGTNWMGSGMNNLGAASHQASSLITAGECFGIAYECDSHEKFLSGGCAICSHERGRQCYVVETLSKGANRYKERYFGKGTVMYVQISSRQTCLYHYQIMAILNRNASASTSYAFESGRVEFDLIIGTVRPNRYYDCKGMQAFTTLFTNEQSLDIDYIHVNPEVVSASDLAAVKINYMSNPLKVYRDGMSFTLCPDGNYLTGRPCSDDIVEMSC